MNDIDPQLRLADVLARIANHLIQAVNVLPPWNWDKAHPNPSGRLIVTAPSYVNTVERVVRMPGETVEALEEQVVQMEPEDSRLWTVGFDDDAPRRVTDEAIDRIPELVTDRRPSKGPE